MAVQATSTQGSSTLPCLFLLSFDKTPFFDELYAPMIDVLSSKATLKRASKPMGALNYLNTQTPTAVIVTDCALTNRKYSAVLKKVDAYVCMGGTVIFCGDFASSVRPDDLARFFSKWGLEWKPGSYQRTTTHLNRLVQLVPHPYLPAAYSQKAVFLKGVAPQARLYIPTVESWTESHVFPQEPVKDLEETPVAFQTIGKGRLGYIGDVNAEIGSHAVVRAMCGLC
ncbi:MAG: hypothetical protein M1833_000561 [Piccolia ochrophora]|nr:MAG: hypothetical protein M1833_000561 [Piccolia ochrophora]